MTINLKGELRFDTRGLPEGYDPHKFYEYRYATVVKDATGLESFLYKYIPAQIIRSFAIAIDPTYQFKVAPHQITPANRVKYRQMASVLQKRQWDAYVNRLDMAQIPHWNNSLLCFSPFWTDVSPPPSAPVHTVLADQDPLPEYLKDTTSRTRLYGSEQGTLELFKGYINSPPRTVVGWSSRFDSYPNYDAPADAACFLQGARIELHRYGFTNSPLTFTPSAARLPLGTYNTLKLAEISNNKALAQKNCISMLKGWSPFQRDYSLYRNLVELRDIPRSIVSLQQTLIDLRKLFVSLGTQPKLRASVFNLRTVAKDIPNEYLSYHFGWKQTYKDLSDLLDLPERLTKRYNFLIRRAGKPTTFRSKRLVASADTSASGFQYDLANFNYEFGNSSSHRIEREHELRLVINATFDFPPLNRPRFLSTEFWDRIGVIPRPTDLYNLTPWTWLLDYFTGFGNYVELIDNINRDPSLVNWGMLTVVTKGKLITDFTSKSSEVYTLTQGSSSVQTTKTWENRHQSVFEYTCQTRQDVSTLMNVNETSVPTSLSAYQKSIIGALLAQRIDNTRSGSFRTRT